MRKGLTMVMTVALALSMAVTAFAEEKNTDQCVEISEETVSKEKVSGIGEETDADLEDGTVSEEAADPEDGTAGGEAADPEGGTASGEAKGPEDGTVNTETAVAAVAVDARTEQFLNAHSDYGYRQLAACSNGANRGEFYKKLDEVSRAYTVNGTDIKDSRIEIDVEKLGLSKKEAKETYQIFLHDNPQYFWIGNKYSFGTQETDPDTVFKFFLYAQSEGAKFEKGQERTAMLNKILDGLQGKYQSKISAGDSAYDKALKLHDALLDNVEWSTDGSAGTTVESTTIVGPLVSGGKVWSEGVSKAMQLLLEYNDIENLFVWNNLGAWNIVKMDDGQYYHLDAYYDNWMAETNNGMKDGKHKRFLAGSDIRGKFELDYDSDSLYFMYHVPETASSRYGRKEPAPVEAMTGQRVEKFLKAHSDYGFKWLGKASNGRARQEMYKKLEESCRDFTINGKNAKESFENAEEGELEYIDISEWKLTVDEADETYYVFLNDNPQYFWIDWYAYDIAEDYMKGLRIHVKGDFQYGANRRATINEMLDTIENVYQSKIDSKDNKYQIVSKLHDTIIEDLVWKDFSDNVYGIVGPLTSEKQGYYSGYAKTMQLLLNYNGIENIYVKGVFDNDDTAAWNMVKMNDGKYYYIDSWEDEWADDQREYFLVGSDKMSSHVENTTDGKWSNFLYDLPKASQTNYDPDAPMPDITKGDVNMDGEINMMDCLLCFDHVSGANLLSGEAFEAADIDGDGEITMMDTLRIFDYISGVSEELSVF